MTPNPWDDIELSDGPSRELTLADYVQLCEGDVDLARSKFYWRSDIVEPGEHPLTPYSNCRCVCCERQKGRKAIEQPYTAAACTCEAADPRACDCPMCWRVLGPKVLLVLESSLSEFSPALTWSTHPTPGAFWRFDPGAPDRSEMRVEFSRERRYATLTVTPDGDLYLTCIDRLLDLEPELVEVEPVVDVLLDLIRRFLLRHEGPRGRKERT